MTKKTNYFLMPFAIVGLFIGVAYTLFANDFFFFCFGCYLLVASIAILIMIGMIYGTESLVWGILTGLGITISLFFLACFFGLPLMPQNETARTIYLCIALPLMLAGGGSGGARVIVIKIFL